MQVNHFTWLFIALFWLAKLAGATDQQALPDDLPDKELLEFLSYYTEEDEYLFDLMLLSSDDDEQNTASEKKSTSDSDTGDNYE